MVDAKTLEVREGCLVRLLATLIGGCGLLWPNVPWRHPLQDSIPHDQRVKQDRPKVSDERQEKEVCKHGVRRPQNRIQHYILRQDKRQVHGAKKDNRIARRRQHSPADQWENEHQTIHREFRRGCHQSLRARHRGGKRRRRIQQPIHEANNDQDQNRDAERAMDRHEHMVAVQRDDHGNADAKHGQDHRGHRPVQQPREGGELKALGCHSQSPLPTSADVIALGCFVSPARLLNDCEYTAERALSKGSSDGLIPAGSTKGSKLISVAALVSSLSTRSSVKVPTSTCWRSAGQAVLASLVGSPGCPMMTTTRHCSGWRWIAAISASKREFLP